MIREALSLAVQKKFFLMFFTCVIYIIGLFAYFTNNAVVIAFLITIFGILAILKNYLSPKLVLFWTFVFFFSFFNASLRIKNSDVLYQIAPQEAVIEGQIVSIPNTVNKKTRFFFNVSKIAYNGKTENINAKTLVNIFGKNFNTGDFYRFEGKLRAPFEATNPSQFDYGKYLKNYGVFTVFYIDANTCEKLDIHLSHKWKFMQGLNNIRQDIIQAHSRCLKSPNLELLGGMVFGDDAIAPTDELKSSFQHSGLLHLLAASGMNVALIYGIWFFILRRLKVPFNIIVSSGIFIVILYSLMTGLGPSVVRAAIMLIFVLIGKLIDRDAHSISLLSFVALLMLIYNPAYINDVGFQLSFLVTFGLLLMTPLIMEKGKGEKEKEEENIPFTIYHSLFTRLPLWLSSAIFIPVIAQIWVAPIQMYYFNSFSLYSVFANILILPFVTVISFGGFISAVLALIKPLAGQICYIFDFVLNPILNIVVFISDFFAKLPHSLIQTPQPNILQMFLYYTIVLLITFILKFGKNKKLIVSACLCLVVLIFSFIKIPNRSLETIFFDVGNADAFLIKTPQNKYFLIDSGKTGYKGGKTQARVIILPYLKDNGIKNIEGLIITHFDSDHAGGAVDLIENLNIKTVYVNSLNDKSHLAQEIYKSTKNNIKLAKNNEIIYKENNMAMKTFKAIFTPEGIENENSIITLVSDRNFDELFMGDAGVLAFDRIKNYLPKQVEILKVGHHGAKNTINKAFLDRINPQAAIISTGINNYGHPNGVTLNLLEQYKIKNKKKLRSLEVWKLSKNQASKLPTRPNFLKALRTDTQNAIKIREQKNNYKIYTYYKNKGFVTNY